MKTTIALITVFTALAASVVAADLPHVPLTAAVYDFTDADETAGSYASKVTMLVTADLTTETNLIMLERAQLKKALGEQALGNSGMVSSDTAAKIGEITGAKALVSGQVMMAGHDRLVIVANIIGTETGRLFAAKVEGPTDKLMDLTSDLSRKIAQKIEEQYPNFVTENRTHEELLQRIVKSVTGTNRPTVLVDIHYSKGVKSKSQSAVADTEMGVILQKAGFVVVDENSDRKPDIEISALMDTDPGPRRGGLFSCMAILDTKVQQRMTGKIIVFDHQTAEGVDTGRLAARKLAQVNVVDGLAERILPLLAK